MPKIIDVDVVINSYNKKNPKLKQMTSKSLAKELGCNPQLFTDWKSGKTPKIVFRLLKMMELGNVKFEELIKEVKQ